jgi:aspartyl-tRNA(Asn)/glutamyl-tRNA(Gln) amidotransferase subunit A
LTLSQDALSDLDGIFLSRPETPAEGTSLAVKDLFDTAHLTTTYGSIVFVDHVPDETAEAVKLLETAGYANVGKTNLHEFAYGTTSENPHFGTVPNPLRAGRIAGGSSGGSAAALAAGLADAALGTDSGGSIRIPSACCGTVGLKPTYGLVSLDGCFPLASSYDHAGPMARSAGECARMLEALAPGFLRAAPVDLGDVEVGVAWTADADPLVRKRVEAAASLFPNRRRIDFPYPPPEGGKVFMREVAEVHRELYAEHADLYGEDVAMKIELCLAVTDAEYEAGLRSHREFREAAEQACAGVDLLLTPTLAVVAPPVGIGDPALRTTLIRFTLPFNILGWPALALPCGPAEDGLPASVQLIGRRGDDALVLAVGEALEALPSLD